MKRNIQLLSNRFINDNKPCIAQSREVRLITNKVAAMIRDKGSLIRITHEQCPFCNGDKVTVIAQKDRYGLPVDTQICDTCELVFSSKYFSADFVEDYYANYADKFKSLNQSPKEMFERRTAPKAYTWIRQNYIKEYLGNNYKKLQIVIEVGCNDGCNLYPYHLDGKKVVGCDFDEQRMDTGRAVGLTILSGGIDVLFHEGYKADLLILSHSLEHMVDIDEVFQNARELLSPHGLLYIEVPGILWHRNDLSKSTVEGYPKSDDILGYLQLEHNYCFELETLRQFACRNGFRIVVGEEVIRALFVIDNQQKTSTIIKKNKNSVLEFLQSVEKHYQCSNPYLKRILRQMYHTLKNAV